MVVPFAPPRLRIGELAAEHNLNAKTIRYYEAIGLLPEPQRTSGGYRVYGPADSECLRFVAKAKAVGLTLGEIAQVLAVRSAGERPCEHVVAIVDRKLADVEARLRELAGFRRELVALREEAARPDGGEAAVCCIIERHETGGAV